MKILVTGATGTVGGSVARALAASEHQTVALVRNPAKYDAPAGVEVIQGDLTVAGDVRRALSGVDRAFLNMADDNGATFAQVAGEVGLGHVVLLSSFAAVTELPLGDGNIITARHRAGEQALTDAGVPATFLRASGFDYNFLMWARDSANGVIRAPWLDVKLPVVDPDDIAASAVAVLTAATPVGGSYSITGPEALSVSDQTDIVAKVIGRDLRAEKLDLDVAKSAAFPENTPDVVVDSVFGAFGPEASVVPVSGDVQALTGRPAHTFAEWVGRNEAAIA
ncbi:NmrA family NAD(P)-binding protein [Micromonospora sp. C51]|uniref:SDR family oxidoreductase n=1 Tax=Micromonospora sp. C51 TaxID=2824879 RepID=UPI001B37A30A|nr:NmrA family NAD(P)-binding protein [Micromonospora sp. C51]MBQ1050130.1 NmrA family NAD(P)-binding protein [Micromonospora sp. C51]